MKYGWRKKTFLRHPLGLTSHGSLTAFLQNYYPNLAVKLLNLYVARPTGYERILVGGQACLMREVVLYSDAGPLVFARSIVPKRDLCGAWQYLKYLGNASLGTWLFAQPRLLRSPLHYKKLSHTQLLTRRARYCLRDNSLSPHWARCSLFSFGTQKMLVSEVFLECSQ